ncbi:hypothetical protein B0H17DRAFT_1048675 [Mycena rosella]|uniref:Uncharacterized protein n=1 Tax=Mycena rosella TaxID=1033263 RepID=A0AAD7DWV2_MYCRO|nr:hypothetical protein B0H17DRAFT_1048675 [Mycena rosella]
MDDSPPPAYSKEYKRPVVVSLNPAPAGAPLDRPESLSKKKGRDSFPTPRPLPRPPGGESAIKPGMVAPLRVHKKAQSTAIPSVERPWKPPSLDRGPPNGWDSAVHPQFRHREAELAPSPVSSHQKYLGRPASPPTPREYARSADHFQPPITDDERAIYARRVPANRPPQVAATVDANSFYK